MAVDHVKSTPVTNLDATPQVTNTAGQGAAGTLREISAVVTAVASSSQDSTYRFVRVPTTVKVKRLRFASEAQGGGTIDFGVYKPTTGKNSAADLVANTHDQDFFASAVAVTSASGFTDITFEASAGYNEDEINTPLWQALGLTADPGGYFDIVGTIVGAITTGTGKMVLSIEFTD